MRNAAEEKSRKHKGMTVRPLTQEDAKQIALLTRRILKELGAEPSLSVNTTIDMFDTPWLEHGKGLVLEDRGKLVGYGWARDSTWNGQKYVHMGLFLGTRYRAPDKSRILTDSLLELARKIGRRYNTPEALVFYQSIDNVHPQIVRAMGFYDLPMSMVGFRHDLREIPKTSLPRGVTIRCARMPEEKTLVLDLSHKAFDDTLNQGEPMHADYLDLIVSRPDFLPEQVLVAECKQSAVGYAVLLISADKPTKDCELIEVGVAPDWRGKGIGPALVSRFLKWCKSRDADSVLTAAFSTNQVTTMYWRLGFRPDAFRTYYFFTRRL